MAQEIAVRSESMEFGQMQRLAEAVAKSRLFGISTPDQALVLMAISQAEGRHPALAARDYDIIQGRPAKKAEAMLRDFLVAGGKVEWHALSDTVADATFAHPQGGTVRVAWDMARATTAGLVGKDMYRKFPRQMLRSRTVSEGVRTVWPMATSGFYVPEEVADFRGDPKDVTPAREVKSDLDTFAYDQQTGEIDVAQPEPEPPLGDRAEIAAKDGTKALKAFWDRLSREDKLALQPHMAVLKLHAATADEDPFGLPPSAPDRPAGSPPSADATLPVDADDAGVAVTHAAARDPQQPPSERKDDADRPVAARGSAETAPPRKPIRPIKEDRTNQTVTYQRMLESIGNIDNAADIQPWRLAHLQIFNALSVPYRDEITRALDEKAALLMMGDGR